jgi:hypothetical protein
VIVQPVVFAAQMVGVSQKISLAAMFHFAQQDYQGHVVAEGVVEVGAEDVDPHQHLQHSLTQNQKVHWSSQ